jgi:hypothetical protein
MTPLDSSSPRAPLARFAVAALAVAMLATCASAGAATSRRAHSTPRHHAPAKTAAAALAPATVTASQGMVVAIDPETGRLGMPTAEQLGALLPAGSLQLSPSERTGLLRTSAGLAAVRRADGSVMIDLQGRFMDYSVVRLDANGRPRLGCVDDAAALSRWLGECESAPRSAPALEVK